MAPRHPNMARSEKRRGSGDRYSHREITAGRTLGIERHLVGASELCGGAAFLGAVDFHGHLPGDVIESDLVRDGAHVQETKVTRLQDHARLPI